MWNHVILNGYIFEPGELVIGNYCLVSIGSYYMIGVLHAYTTTEYCFKNCKYYIQDEEQFIPWTDPFCFKPLHWIDRDDSIIWAKSRKYI